MRLIDMLNATVTPLSARVPESAERKRKKPTVVSSHIKTVARYRKLTGGRWVTTRVLEELLGVGKSCVIGTLNKWEAKGIVERRKPCPDREWNRKKGYEWRMK